MGETIKKCVGKLLNAGSWILPAYTRELAVKLLSRVPRVPINEMGMSFLNNAKTHWLNIQGVPTALHQWGKGSKKVLFLHGWMSSSPRWKSVIESMDPEFYTAFALDAPAHGMSKGKSLNLEVYRQAYVAALEFTGPVGVVVGHSFGNLVAAYQFLYDPKVAVGSYVVMGAPSGMDAIFGYFVNILSLSPRMISNVSTRVDQVLKIPHQKLSMANFFRLNNRPKLIIHDTNDDITPITPVREALVGQENIDVFFTKGLDHTLKSPEIDARLLQFIEQQTIKKENHVPKEF